MEIRINATDGEILKLLEDGLFFEARPRVLKLLVIDEEFLRDLEFKLINERGGE